MRLPRWARLLFASRARLRRECCAKGEHVWSFWRWTGSIQFHSNMEPQAGWFRRCAICRTAFQFVDNEPRPTGAWPWRRRLAFEREASG